MAGVHPLAIPVDSSPPYQALLLFPIPRRAFVLPLIPGRIPLDVLSLTTASFRIILCEPRGVGDHRVP